MIDRIFIMRLFQMVSLIMLTPFMVVGATLFSNNKNITTWNVPLSSLMLMVFVICLLFFGNKQIKGNLLNKNEN